MEDLKFLSDPLLFGRHVVDLNASNNVAVRTYVWGLDLSETLKGAGGVGGLLWVTLHSGSGPTAGTHFCAYDGNGNIVALSAASDGSETARYEYGPFGEPIRVSGAAAANNPFRFSTKRTCNTTDLVLYEYRVYSPTLGRWPNRDPLGEWGGVNLYAAMGNQLVNVIDALGLECVGHTCQPGQPPGYDEDGFHFCGPPSPPPPPRPHDPPGYNRVPPYNPPDEGKPCCIDPALLKKAKRTDPPPTEGSKRSDGGSIGRYT